MVDSFILYTFPLNYFYSYRVLKLKIKTLLHSTNAKSVEDQKDGRITIEQFPGCCIEHPTGEHQVLTGMITPKAHSLSLEILTL